MSTFMANKANIERKWYSILAGRDAVCSIFWGLSGAAWRTTT